MKSESTSVGHSILAITACLLWASAVVAAKYALAYRTPLVLAGERFILAGLLLLPLSGSLLEPFRLIRRETKTVLLISFFQTIYLYSTFFYAMYFVRGAEAAIVIGTTPLASALVAHWMTKDDKFHLRGIFSQFFGLAGIVIISLSTKPWEPVGMKEFFWLMVLLSGSFASGIGNVLIAKRKGSMHPVALCSAQMLVGAPILLLFGILIEGAPKLVMPLQYYGYLLWLACISAVGFSVWFLLLGKVKVSKLNIWKFIIPFFGAILSWILLPGESPTLFNFTGMALIVIGVIVGQWRR